MCSNASITEILGINDNNLVILGNEKENTKGIGDKDTSLSILIPIPSRSEKG